RRSDNRPGLQAALAEACRPGGVLVVYSLSRLARSTRDTIAIGERLRRAGGGPGRPSPGGGTTTAGGRKFFRLLAVVGGVGRGGGVEGKGGGGECLGQVPYGLRRSEDGRTLVPEVRDREALALARRLRSEGRSLRGIAAELTRSGYPTKRGGPRWSHRSVSQI